jgi:hypothetical protein
MENEIQAKAKEQFAGLCGTGVHSNVAKEFGWSERAEPDWKVNQEGC